MNRDLPLVIHCYRDIRRLTGLTLPEWDLLIRQGRRAGLLGRLHAMAERAELLDALPEKPACHLTASRVEADRVAGAARWEMGQIAFALQRLWVPVIALKGAAYALSGRFAAEGRAFSDLDILVPRPALEDVEQQLIAHGWLSTHLDEYDQRYYRRWMHEIPPMRHIRRKTNLDIHHGILPETVSRRPDPRLLLDEAIELEALPGVYTLSPVDTWLHSATHLFQEGEFHNGLRDLTDLDLLTREMAGKDGFWDQLVARSQVLNLTRQLYYGLRYTQRLLATPVPEEVLESTAAFAPPQPLKGLMDGLFQRALLPLHSSCDPATGPAARWALYIRSHAIRMPPHLLLPHLAHKAFVTPYRQWREERERARQGGMVPRR